MDTEAEIVTPRRAASVVVVRDGDEGVEVLLLRRTSKAAFAPDRFVFVERFPIDIGAAEVTSGDRQQFVGRCGVGPTAQLRNQVGDVVGDERAANREVLAANVEGETDIGEREGASLTFEERGEVADALVEGFGGLGGDGRDVPAGAGRARRCGRLVHDQVSVGPAEAE